MHETLTTCNSQNVWPEHAGTMAGLRTVPRSQLGIINFRGVTLF